MSCYMTEKKKRQYVISVLRLIELIYILIPKRIGFNILIAKRKLTNTFILKVKYVVVS